MYSIPYDASRTSLFKPGEATDFFDYGPIPSEAALCAEMARLAYCKDLTLLDQYLARNNASFTLIRAFGYGEPGSQAFIAKSQSKPIVVVAFRGTEPDDPSDLFTDARFTQVLWESGGKVHAGFADAWNQNGFGIAIEQELQSHSDCRVLFTGHSLGAALATLAASATNPGNFHLYTFGCPRVGDAEFARRFEHIDHARYVDCSDIVTRVPPEGFGYVHVGTLRYIDRNGKIRESMSEADITFDRIEGATNYVMKYALLKGTLFSREMADHAPINYVSAVMGLRP